MRQVPGLELCRLKAWGAWGDRPGQGWAAELGSRRCWSLRRHLRRKGFPRGWQGPLTSEQMQVTLRLPLPVGFRKRQPSLTVGLLRDLGATG